MGKGDKKTKRGKISSGSFGVTRPHKKKSDSEVTTKEKSKEKAGAGAKASAKPEAKKEGKK